MLWGSTTQSVGAGIPKQSLGTRIKGLVEISRVSRSHAPAWECSLYAPVSRISRSQTLFGNACLDALHRTTI